VKNNKITKSTSPNPKSLGRKTKNTELRRLRESPRLKQNKINKITVHDIFT
jgi:hypothetical protein